jgi:hypothetical protein
MDEALALRFVKEGMAWWGLLMPPAWLLLKGMWLVFVLVVAAIGMIIGFGAAFGLGTGALLILVLAVHVVIGVFGNDLLRWTLARRGFVEAGHASGRRQDEAELRYFLAQAAEEPPRPAPAASLAPQDHDPLGLFARPAS